MHSMRLLVLFRDLRRLSGNHPPWNADTSGQGQGLPLGNQHADTFPHLQLDTSNLEGLFSGMLSFPESIPYLMNQKM